MQHPIKEATQYAAGAAEIRQESGLVCNCGGSSLPQYLHCTTAGICLSSGIGVILLLRSSKITLLTTKHRSNKYSSVFHIEPIKILYAMSERANQISFDLKCSLFKRMFLFSTRYCKKCNTREKGLLKPAVFSKMKTAAGTGVINIFAAFKTNGIQQQQMVSGQRIAAEKPSASSSNIICASDTWFAAGRTGQRNGVLAKLGKLEWGRRMHHHRLTHTEPSSAKQLRTEAGLVDNTSSLAIPKTSKKWNLPYNS